MFRIFINEIYWLISVDQSTFLYTFKAITENWLWDLQWFDWVPQGNIDKDDIENWLVSPLFFIFYFFPITLKCFPVLGHRHI